MVVNTAIKKFAQPVNCDLIFSSHLLTKDCQPVAVVVVVVAVAGDRKKRGRRPKIELKPKVETRKRERKKVRSG